LLEINHTQEINQEERSHRDLVFSASGATPQDQNSNFSLPLDKHRSNQCIYHKEQPDLRLKQDLLIVEHVESALTKLEEFTIKKADSLDEETKKIFEIIKNNSGSKIGELYILYQQQEGLGSYKTFQRRVVKLNEGKFVTLTKSMGVGGNTTIVDLVGKGY